MSNGNLPGNQGVLSAAMKPPPSIPLPAQPLPISLSIETNGAIQGITGKSISQGKVYGLRRDMSIIDCTYSTACDLLGVGIMYGAGVGVGITGSAPSSGISSSSGGLLSGGAMGSASVQRILDNDTNVASISIGVAKGDGASASQISCVQKTEC